MEEDIDDKFFYDFPDNPALIEAQQPFLEILSDPSSNSTSDDSNNRAVSPCSPSDASVGTAAQLPPTPAAVDSYDRFQFEPVDLDPAAFFGGGANSDLMSSAFLKGMQEANKFLPSQDKLVIDLEASSGQFFKGVEEGNKFLPREDKLVAGFNGHAAPAPAPVVLSVKKEEAVDAVSANSGGGRGRKNPYQSLMATRISAVDMLKAYQLYMAAICFKKVSFLFSNSTIYNASLGKKKIHIIDYGIQYGFQWPCFLRRISTRPGGPPNVRITGIDLPQPGFRPTERIEETGRRLKKYAHEFNVPFEYRAIATAKMESLRKEDLKIDPDEVLIVNSLFQFKNLMDESVVLESPRDVVLKNIRKMRPHTFIHAIVNGSFSAPFFVTRFREVLFYYSALFDVLDTTTPRDNEQRMLIEQNILGRAALNVIACEGTDRVERPETYKQWQVRNQRAGLKLLPLNPEVIELARDKVKNCYHKDFVIDIDQHWLLQGWKGRILYAISTWTANDASS
ncbi:unnamed protein product [Triticum turgidum subsp. durum]|uniref:Scarecrow-like protein 9 n=1 Tax=Triticum turgidum subsp. durum TaxID=4567 RepID=A0A9R1AHT7_TRITD|nr:unnamed protein product [Triticum turgidum subsp. durum]